MRTSDQQARKAERMERDAEAAEARARQLRGLAVTAREEAARLAQQEGDVALASCAAIERRHAECFDSPVLVRDQAGDWCQLEKDGKLFYRGHLSDLDAETFADTLGMQLCIQEGTLLADGRSFG